MSGAPKTLNTAAPAHAAAALPADPPWSLRGWRCGRSRRWATSVNTAFVGWGAGGGCTKKLWLIYDFVAVGLTVNSPRSPWPPPR